MHHLFFTETLIRTQRIENNRVKLVYVLAICNVRMVSFPSFGQHYRGDTFIQPVQ